MLGLKEARALSVEDVTARGLVRSGHAVARIAYYRLELEDDPVFALVHLTREGLVTDFDLVAE